MILRLLLALFGISRGSDHKAAERFVITNETDPAVRKTHRHDRSR
jgi:hypothetical protein